MKPRELVVSKDVVAWDITCPIVKIAFLLFRFCVRIMKPREVVVSEVVVSKDVVAWDITRPIASNSLHLPNI